MINKPFLTILTPVYNRANLLPRVFECLKAQTDTDFEWIIIDDGSSDHSLAVARSFVTDKFPIQVLSKSNGGKHTALNYTHPYINGKYVLILDSDDSLIAHAVASIKREWEKYQQNTKIGILIFLRGNNDGNPFCTISQYNQPVNLLACKRNHIISGDCCEVIRADVFRQFPFPQFSGENFLSESALWCRVSETYLCVYINQIIYICEYLTGGLTKLGKKLRIRNPRGGQYVANLKLSKANGFAERIKQGLLYTCYAKFSGDSFAQIKKQCSNKTIFYSTYLGGLILYLYWKHKWQK